MVNKNDKTLWGIHGGKTGDADNLFLKHGVIALGWVEMGDMSKLATDREAFKAKMLEIWPNRKERYYWIAAGQVLQHYEEFDSRYKGLLPLKRVYVPEPLEEAET